MIDTELTWQQKVAALALQYGREPTLRELIDLNRGHTMTEEEWIAQRGSFVRGQIGMGSDRDEAEYRTKFRGEESQN